MCFLFKLDATVGVSTNATKRSQPHSFGSHWTEEEKAIGFIKCWIWAGGTEMSCNDLRGGGVSSYKIIFIPPCRKKLKDF